MNTCSTHTDGNLTRLTIHRHLDHDSEPDIERAALALLCTGADLTLEMGEVAFMDIAGLRLLQALRRRMSPHGGRLRVVGLAGQPKRVLSLADELFPADRWGEFLSSAAVDPV